MPDTFTPSDQFTSILPCEIVGYIFRLCLHPIKQGGLESNHPPSPTVPLRFSHVSRTWRAIVHDTPALWTNVCIHSRSAHPDPEILAHILRHSNNWSLSVCIVIIGGGGVESMEWIGVCVKELFCHAHRIRSFRLDVRSQVGLWGEDVPMPSFSRLEDLKILGSITERDNERLYPLFDSPQLRNVTWLSRVRFPEPLLRVGAQIKQLILPVCAIEYMRVAELLQACPNVTHLDVCPKGPYRPVSNYPICLPELHSLRSSELGVDLIIAPNLRHLTLTLSYPMALIQPTGELHEMVHLPQFLSLAPRIEYLHLELWQQQPLDLISQIVPLTPCLITLEISFRQFQVPLPVNTMFEMLTCGGTSTFTLPKLQHLKLNIFVPPKVDGPLMSDTEKLLRMLESRCIRSPSLHQTRLQVDGPPALADLRVAALRSFVMNQSSARTDARSVNLTQKLLGPQCKQRLEVLRGRGLVLGGNILKSLLDGFPLGRGPPYILSSEQFNG